jgi:hypothetical protein
VRAPTNDVEMTLEPPQETAVFCHYYRHIAKLSQKSPLPLALYCLISTVSNKSDRFGVSLRDVADYFGVDFKNLHTAKDKLVEAGWLVKLTQEDVLGKPTLFRAVTHDEWIKNPKNALTCCAKRSFNPSVGDALGNKLKKILGVTLFPKVLAQWRGLGFTDDELYIFAHWRIHQEREEGWKRPGRVKRITGMMEAYGVDYKGRPTERTAFVEMLRKQMVKAGVTL